MHLNILVFFTFILLGGVILGLILWWGDYQSVRKPKWPIHQVHKRGVTYHQNKATLQS